MRYVTPLLMGLAASCSNEAIHRPVTEFEGVFISGYETAAFEPCQNRESWWLDISDDATPTTWPMLVEHIEKNQKIAFNGDLRATLLLKVDAHISEPGQFGHLGGFDREISVTVIKSINNASEADISRCVDSPLFGDRNKYNE